MRDGQKVSYVGDGHDGRALGEHGQLLTTLGRTAHVKWAVDETITSVDRDDIVPANLRAAAARPAAPRDGLEDSLDVGPIASTGVRAALESEGPAGVINALASGGHLGDFPEIAEELVVLAEHRIRRSASFREVAVQLDEDEFDELTRLAALVLLRDAFSGEVDG